MGSGLFWGMPPFGEYHNLVTFVSDEKVSDIRQT